jgi:hypothetical protein
MAMKDFSDDLNTAQQFFPAEVKSVRLQITPTTLEFRSVVNSQNFCCICTLLLLFIVSIFIMRTSVFGGVFLLILVALISLGIWSLNRHTKNNPFIFDLEHQQISPDLQRTIPWTQIQMIQLVQKQVSHQGNRGIRRQNSQENGGIIF